MLQATKCAREAARRYACGFFCARLACLSPPGHASPPSLALRLLVRRGISPQPIGLFLLGQPPLHCSSIAVRT